MDESRLVSISATCVYAVEVVETDSSRYGFAASNVSR